MNLGELVEVTRAKYLSATHALKGVNFNRAFAVTAINLGYRRIERGALWTFSEAEDEISSVANQWTPASMPGDLAKALMLYDLVDEFELTYHDDRQAVLPQKSTGVPSHYSEWSGDLKFWPRPVSARDYLLRYYFAWSDLVGDNDVPVLPSQFHELLASYATRTLVLRTPPEGDRFLPASAAEPFEIEWRDGLMSLLESPYTLKSLDRVPLHEHDQMVVEGAGQLW